LTEYEKCIEYILNMPDSKFKIDESTDLSIELDSKFTLNPMEWLTVHVLLKAKTFFMAKGYELIKSDDKTITLNIVEFETIRELVKSELKEYKDHTNNINPVYEKKIERLEGILKKIGE